MQCEDKEFLEIVPTKYAHVKNIKYHLQFKAVRLGSVDESGEGTFIATPRTETHLFRKTNSLGINYDLLVDERLKFKWIVIPYCEHKLISTRNYFLKKGKAFQFGKKGFELQIFVPVNELNIHTARKFEFYQVFQENLFAEVV